MGDWYDSALTSRELHSALIVAGESLAVSGPATVATDLKATADTLAQRLRDARPEVAVPLASIPGAGVRLDDFLRTRFIEITVHADDIASSVGLRSPDFPSIAWTLAASAVAEATNLDGSDSRFVLTTSRPGRTAPDDRTDDA
jgi:Mycothiol maleylpyruvate isomerase N-terminal domain